MSYVLLANSENEKKTTKKNRMQKIIVIWQVNLKV